MEVRSTLSADCLSSCLPTAVEPVKESLRRRGSASSGSEIADADEEVTTLSTPAGRPASSIVWAK